MMNDTRFDQLRRLIAAAASRREIIKTAAWLVVGALTGLRSAPWLTGRAQEIASAEEQVFSYFLGTWDGIGIQTNPSAEWALTVTIFGGSAGSIVATVEYADLGCSGDLILNRIDLDDFFLDLTERITEGQGTCVDGGHFTIESPSDNLMAFSWSDPNRSATARGTLSRVDEALSEDFGTGHVVVSSRTCIAGDAEELYARWDVVYPNSGITHLGGGCVGARPGYEFTITSVEGSVTSGSTDLNGQLELDLTPGDYTIVENVSGEVTAFTVSQGETVTVALSYWGPPGTDADATLNPEPPPDEGLVEAIKLARKQGDERLLHVRETASACNDGGAFFARKFPEDQAQFVAELFLSGVSLGLNLPKVNTGTVLRSLRPGMNDRTTSLVAEFGRKRGGQRLLQALGAELQYTGVGVFPVKAFMANLLEEAVQTIGLEATVNLTSAAIEDELLTIMPPVLESGRAHGIALAAMQYVVGHYRNLLKDIEKHALANLPSDPALTERYMDHLVLTNRANTVIGESLAEQMVSLQTAKIEREQDDADWLPKFSIEVLGTVAISAGYLLGGVPGLAISGGLALYDNYQNYVDMTESQRFSRFGFEGLYATHREVCVIFTNAFAAIAQIAVGDGATFEPLMPKGRATFIRDVERDGQAYSEVEIVNDGGVAADFRLLARYEYSFKSWPFAGFSTHVVHGDAVVSLAPGKTARVRLIYRRDGGGQPPLRGSDVTRNLLGTTDTGAYFVERAYHKWEP